MVLRVRGLAQRTPADTDGVAAMHCAQHAVKWYKEQGRIAPESAS